jgi:hypothetical protein
LVLSVFVFLALSTRGRCQSKLAPTGWSAIEGLKKGSWVMVDRVLASGEYEERLPCRMVRVDADSLVCSPRGGHGTRLVYPAERVASVYLCKTRVSPNFVKMILYGGAGWVAGGIITDEKWDYPLAMLGAVGGGLYGLASNRPEQKQILIYRRAPSESVNHATSP